MRIYLSGVSQAAPPIFLDIAIMNFGVFFQVDYNDDDFQRSVLKNGSSIVITDCQLNTRYRNDWNNRQSGQILLNLELGGRSFDENQSETRRFQRFLPKPSRTQTWRRPQWRFWVNHKNIKNYIFRLTSTNQSVLIVFIYSATI